MPKVTTSIAAIIDGCSKIPSGGRKTFYFHSFVTNSDLRNINRGFKNRNINTAIEIDGNIIRIKII